MDDPKTLDLLSELVTRLRSSSSAAAAGDLRYAKRLLSSRLCSSLSQDEHAMAESIKRSLASSGKSSEALTFADLHSKLAARSSLPGSIQNRWALLYLLKSLSDNPRLMNSVNGGLPYLPLEISNPNPSSAAAGQNTARKKNMGYQTGVLHISKDPENVRENAMREYSDLVMESTELEESALVRDVLYACQGIDGRYVRYGTDGYDLPDSICLPKSTKIMIKKLCELGWLFKKVKTFIENSMSNFPSEKEDSVGTIGHAFCSALKDELTDYYKLLAILESHSTNPIPQPGSDLGFQTNYLSLRRLSVWLAEPTVRMRLMAVLTEICNGLKGGAMASAIHKQAQHGDPIVRDFMSKLLKRVCSPLFKMVRVWVLEGELEDVFNEFFIVEQPVKAESLWQEGYRIETSMVPCFISDKLARKIFRTGKSINFLRVCCDDSEWAKHVLETNWQERFLELENRFISGTDRQAGGTGTGNWGLGYGQTDELETLVFEAAGRIDKHLMHVIYDRFRFKDHCLAIKRYLLLGQGDFVQSLMHEVGPDLSDSANKISNFQLASKLETSIRASNSQYDDRDILDRLKVKLMDSEDGNTGWDVFSLEYEATKPLDAIFNCTVMNKYLRIFNYLWRLKRVEDSLTHIWKSTKPNFIISRIFTKKGENDQNKLKLIPLLRKFQVLWNEMNHFITNFQYYIMFEVLEESWARFSYEMEASSDFDDLLVAHEKYLSSILEKSLLGEKSGGLLEILCRVFEVVLRFRNRADGWLEPFYALQLRPKKSDKNKSQRGPRNALTQLDERHLRKMGEDLDQIAKEYSNSLDSFIKQLPLQQHVDLKYLFFRLNFTEYYSRPA
ncbi:hypothetical protein LUZ60_002801 [Juncus effusus]|nr:hypothetical protein LUZ60_002801 [Juncus effusus]